ncbi:FtsX-like permease family protein [Thalassotalea sp. HSM 43]|uniref:ABC transporter permease n=1 Tax=Thalassotalea sp. HSM 43 TaxID=2552945 RepID=UPI001080388D|nr:ABC transporter permease [Thalassotalea sp. HSM 43]QBY05383.1 FtsX-like permease family protein [Thalassotalea sp. HSM 43]
MFLYYLKLARISIIKHWGMSALMIVAIALGIGASMTTVTVTYLMSANPIPHKSDNLYYVQLDSWDVNNPANDDGTPPDQVTYRDGLYLFMQQKAYRQSIQAQANAVIEPEGKDALPFQVSARANSADFFSMFDVPFIYGSGWDHQADISKEQVVVLSRETNDRVFGGENSVGRSIKVAGNFFKVVGVIDTWQPVPRFYDITTGAFNESEEIFVPFSMIAEEKIGRSGNTNCWKNVGDGFQAFLDSECVWLQFWVELNNEQEKQEYQSFLNAYVEQQKSFGRFERPLNNRLSNVMEWLEQRQVVADDALMMTAMSLMFLIVCLLNTVGLLLAKFLSKSSEIGLRQALGASRRTLFAQYLVESGCIGLAGGLLGLFFAWLGLKGIDVLYGDMLRNLTSLDTTMVVAAISLAIVTSLLAGLYPTWRACNVQPSTQLKAQ